MSYGLNLNVFLCLFVLLFSASLVFAAENNDSWGDFAEEDNSGEGITVDDLPDSGDEEIDGEAESLPSDVEELREISQENRVSEVGADSGSASRFTTDFYIAAGFGIFGLLILAYLAYSLLKKPAHKWKK